MALPLLLKELKANGYRVVHVEAAGERPKSLPELPAPALADSGNWPKVIRVSASSEDEPVRKHARTRVAHRHAHAKIARNERDPDITASISKRKSKAQTAQSDSWMQPQR
jgi:hypothetical protein